MAITAGELKGAKRRKVLGKTEKVIQDIPNNQLPEIILQSTMENTMRDFAQFTGEKFRKSIWSWDVRHEGDLYESVKTRVSKGSSKITGSFSFNFYGRFADMGVGKGVTLIEQQTGRGLTANRNPSRILRKPKPWFTEVWYHQRHRLQEILARDIAKAATQAVSDTLPAGELPLSL